MQLVTNFHIWKDMTAILKESVKGRSESKIDLKSHGPKKTTSISKTRNGSKTA